MAELVNKTDSTKGVLILHGGSAGTESSFIQKTFKSAKEHGLTVLAYDFPYLQKPDKKPSGGFIEEAQTVKEAINRLHQEGVKDLHIVAKSVGSAILSKALKDISDTSIRRVTIMGLPIGLTDLQPFSGKDLEIVQGSLDRFGNTEAVKKELSKAGIEANVIEISSATHSFRDAQTDTQPIYEDEAISKIDWDEL